LRHEKEQKQAQAAAFHRAREKEHRDNLRKAAQDTAKKVGAFSPICTSKYLQKTVARYNKRPDIGVDLADQTSKAYGYYLSRLAVPGTPGNGDSVVGRTSSRRGLSSSML